MTNFCIIDASGLIYRAYFAIRNLTTKNKEPTGALYGFVRTILKLRTSFPHTYWIAVFDGPNNKRSRLEIYPEYKAHRPPTPPELIHQVQEAKKFCTLLGLPMIAQEGVEADDVIASIAVWAKTFSHVSICSADKDLYQLIDETISLIDPQHDFKRIDRAGCIEKWGVEPHQIIDYLSLIGDSSDNVPGVDGLGPKSALDLLHEWGSLESILNNAASIKGKRGQTLVTQRAQAELSKQLVTLKSDLPAPKELTFYEPQAPNKQSLQEFYSQKEFKTLLKELLEEEGATTQTLLPPSPGTPPASSLIIVSSIPTFEELKQEFKNNPTTPICIDCETTSLDQLHAQLVGIGLGFSSSQVFYIPVLPSSYTSIQSQVLEYLIQELAGRPLIGHNLKFDLHILSRCGFFNLIAFFDTLIASYLLSAHERRHGLDILAEKYFQKRLTPIEELIGTGKHAISMDQVPVEKVARYCGDDVEYTLRLKNVLEEELKQRALDKLFFEMEMPLLPILQRLEHNGVYIHTPLIQETLHDVKKTLLRLEEEIYQLAGHPFTITSPKQLADVLFHELKLPHSKKTKTSYSTDIEVLEGLSPYHPIAQKLIEFRTLDKLRSTYLEVLPQMVNPSTGRIHAHFNQWGTTTGRLSCTDPNLQNIPVRTDLGKKIRQAFQAQDPLGWIISCDYSQIELRVLAHMSQDPILIKAFQEGADIHARTAAEIFGVPEPMVDKEMRRQAKAVNFGVLYGQQAFGLSQQLNIPIGQAARFIENYFQRFKRVKEFLEELKIFARKEGKAVTLTGRERLLPDIDSKNGSIRLAQERLAVNTPFQGSAADIMKLAMLSVDRWLTTEKCQGKMILQIHDELLFEVLDHEKELFVKKIPELMSSVMPMSIPLVCDVAVGKNWANAS